MIVAFQSVVPMDDYTLEVTMTNSNRLKFDMQPYLNTIEFCPLKDKNVWKNVEVHDTYLFWKGGAEVELSIDTLLAYFKIKEDSQ